MSRLCIAVAVVLVLVGNPAMAEEVCAWHLPVAKAKCAHVCEDGAGRVTGWEAKDYDADEPAPCGECTCGSDLSDAEE